MSLHVIPSVAKKVSLPLLETNPCLRSRSVLTFCVGTTISPHFRTLVLCLYMNHV
uniref:Uncharacterized protein n=1 Tax=Anguilla anguilla TaxID=7936 RepID=A0A0E9VZV9_ANGAN